MSWIHQTEHLCVYFWRRLRLDWNHRCKDTRPQSHSDHYTVGEWNESDQKNLTRATETQQNGGGGGSPVLRCWLGLLGCMEPWQTGGCTAPSGGITPVRAKNWLMDEHRSAIWVGSRDQLFSSACLILSLNPWKYKKQKERVRDVISLHGITFVTMKCMTECPKTNLQT